MRIVFALLVALVCARLALDLDGDLQRAIDVGISLIVLVILQGWVLQSMFVVATGESLSLRTACSSCAMVMFLGAMSTLLLVFLLMAVLGSHAQDLSFIALPGVNVVVSAWMYWYLTTPGFCGPRLSITPPGRGAGIAIALVMSVIQLLLYVLVYLFLRP